MPTLSILVIEDDELACENIARCSPIVLLPSAR